MHGVDRVRAAGIGLDSHFYSASPAECAAALDRFANAWILETSDLFDIGLPDQNAGTCAAGTAPVYRLYNGRPDANHQYTADAQVRSSMIAVGWTPEGYGTGGVSCAARFESAFTSSYSKNGARPLSPTREWGDPSNQESNPDREAMMAHTLTHDVRPTTTISRHNTPADDPLAAARGIMFGILISVLGFWLPLAIALIR